jgi:hypothetical protein
MMNTHRCRVLLVDDHDLIRDVLLDLLSSYEHVEIIGEARDGEEAIIRVGIVSARYHFNGYQHAKDERHSGNKCN